MTLVALTTQPDAAIATAAAVMFEGRCGSLPVVENGKLVGILTERDLLGTLASLTPDRKLDLEGFLW
jgi:CBS domain-containing protein